MSRRRVLIVEDDREMREMLAMTIERAGYEVAAVDSGEGALEAIAADPFDAVLTDVRMPGMSGIELLGRMREAGVEATVIVMTAYGTMELAMEAMGAGAYDYVTKPFKRDEVLLALRKAEERERLRREVRRLRARVERDWGEGAPIFRSAAMAGVLETAERAARYKTTVLLTGESGTGKEVLARFIHARSERAARPFVAINCGAIPPTLIESELFGHARGAFTGATAAKRGLFEEADGGTLFLDEIAELPKESQASLLRVLQEGEVRRVGDNRAVSVDVRVIAATARELDAEIEAGRFRRDLFYRLHVIPIRIPALRERPEDIPVLLEYFASKCSSDKRIDAKVMAPDALRLCQAYPWPGNVRELENAIERAAVLGAGRRIEAEDLPAEVRAAAGAADADLSIKRGVRVLEIDRIRAALARTGGNRTEAAKLLEVSYRKLLYKIEEYEIDAGADAPGGRRAAG